LVCVEPLAPVEFIF
jgi:hypothetical protein